MSRETELAIDTLDQRLKRVDQRLKRVERQIALRIPKEFGDVLASGFTANFRLPSSSSEANPEAQFTLYRNEIVLNFTAYGARYGTFHFYIEAEPGV